MSTTQDGVLEIALNSNWFFTDTRADDFIMRTQHTSQNIAIGTACNTTSAIYISSNSINLNKPVTFAGGFQISGSANTDTDLVIGGNATVSNNLLVLKTSELRSNLLVDGLSTFQKLVTMSSNVLVNGTATLCNLVVSGPSTFSNNTVTTGSVVIHGVANLSNNLTVTGATFLQGNMVVSGNATLSNALMALNKVSVSNSLDVSGRTQLSNTLTVASNLWVQGPAAFSNTAVFTERAHFSNNIVAASPILLSNVLNISSNCWILGGTSVSNVFNVSGGAHFSNFARITSNLWVQGGASFSNNINIFGSLTTSNITILQSNLVVAGDVTFSNPSTLYGLVTISNNLLVHHPVTFCNMQTITGTLQANSNVIIVGQASISNNLVVAGTATVSNLATFQSNVIILGTTTLSNALVTTGVTTFSNAVQGFSPVSLSNTLDVSGLATISNALVTTSNVWVQGALSASNSMTVSGGAHFSNFVRITSNLWVNGATSMSNNLNVFGTLTASNVVALQSNLTVTGPTAFNNTLVATGPITLSNTVVGHFPVSILSNLHVSGITSLSNSLNVSAGAHFSNFMQITSNLWVNGVTSLSNNLIVIGATTMSNSATLQSNLLVLGPTLLSNNVIIAGTTTLSNNLQGFLPVSLSNKLDVSGIVAVSNAAFITSNLWVQGVMSASNDMIVSGATHFSNFVRITSNLWVNGAVSVSNSVNVSGALTVSNVTTLQSNVVIAGTMTTSNVVTTLSNMNLSNIVNAFFPATFHAATAFSNVVTYNSNIVTIGAITAYNNVIISSNLNIRGAETIEGVVTYCNIVNLNSNLAGSNADIMFANYRTTGASNQQLTISAFRGLPQLRIHNTSNASTIPFIVTQSSNGVATLCNAGDIEVFSASNIRLLNAITVSNASLQIPGMTVATGAIHASNTATFASNVFMAQPVTMCNTLDISGTARISNIAQFYSNVTFNRPTLFNDRVSISNVIDVSSNVTLRGLVSLASNTAVFGPPATEKFIVYGDIAVSNNLGKAVIEVVDDALLNVNGSLIMRTITSNFNTSYAVSTANTLRTNLPTQLVQLFAADIPITATNVATWGPLSQSIVARQPAYTVSNNIFPYVSMSMSNSSTAARFLDITSNIGPFSPAASNAFSIAFFARFYGTVYNSNESYFGFMSPSNNTFITATRNAGSSNFLLQLNTGGATTIPNYILYNTWTSYVIVADGATNTYITYRNGVAHGTVNSVSAFNFGSFVSDFLGKRPTHQGVLGNNGVGDATGSTVDYAAFSVFQYGLSATNVSNWHHSMMATMAPLVTVSASLSNNSVYTSNLIIQSNAVFHGTTTFSNTVNTVGNMTILGATTFCNNTAFTSNTVFNAGNAFLGEATFSNNVNFFSNVTFRSVPTFSSNVQMNCNLIVSGVTSLCNNVNIASNLTVAGSLNVQSIVTSNVLIYDVNTIRSNLFVLNTTTLCNNVNIYGPTGIYAPQTSYSNATFLAGMVVSSNSTFSNNVRLLSNVDILGEATISNVLNVTGTLRTGSNIRLSNFGTLDLFTSNSSLGVGTTAPSERLELASGNAKFPANVYVLSNLTVGGTSNTSSGVVTIAGCNFTADTPAILLRNMANNNSNNSVSISMATSHNMTTAQARILTGSETTTTDGFMSFATRTSTALVERVRVTSTGFLGIGTSNPLRNLHISSNAPSVLISSTNSNTGPRIELSNADNGLVSFFGHEANQVTRLGTVSSNDFALITSNVERVRVVGTTGFVGVNNPTPTYRLDIVAGTSNGFTACNALRVWTQVMNTSNSDAIVISEDGASASGRQAIAWRSENAAATFVKSRIWAIVGENYNASMMGFDVADATRVLQTRMVIDTQGRLGVGTSAPLERVHIALGHARFDSNAFVLGHLSVGSSNTPHKVNIDGTLNITGVANNGLNSDSRAAYILLNTNDVNATTMAIQSLASNNHMIAFDSFFNNAHTRTSTANPFAITKSNNRLLMRYAASGTQNTTFTWSNAMAINNQGFVGINTESPSESLDVVGGNVKVGSNLYVMSNLGIGKSNPAFALDIVGSINFTGSFNQNGLSFTGSRWTSNNQGIIYNFTSSNVGIGTNALNEKFTLSNGNAIMYSNLYVMNSIGIGKSNPAYALDVNGDINMTGSAVIRQNGSPAVFSQWSNTSSSVFITGSNVGIGLSNPTTPLHVIGNTLVQGSMGTLGLTVGRRNATIVSGTPGASGAGAYDALSNLLFTIPTSGNSFRFNVSSTTIAVVDGSGSVGIGLSNPAERLQVVGKVVTDSQFLFTGGSNSNIPCYSFSGNSNTGMYNAAANAVGFVTNGTERVRINAAGQVGIGTSNPGYSLDVAGSINFTSNLFQNGVLFQAGGGGWSNDTNGVTTSCNVGIKGPSTVNDELIVYGDIAMSNFGLTTFYTSNNLLGIGVSNPSYSLHIRSNMMVQGSHGNNNYLSHGRIYLNDFSYGIGVGRFNQALMEDMLYLWAFDGANRDIVFTHTSNGATDPRTWKRDMVIQGLTGNVGIGLSNPAERLQVVGKVVTDSQFLFTGGSNSNVPCYSFSGNSNTGMYNAAMNALGFVTNGTERVRITSAGNVGIGLSNPNAPLQFNNNVSNRKIVMYDDVNNDNQYFGFGLNSGILRYQVGGTDTSHVFYAGVNATTSSELLRITGSGNVGIGTSSPSYKLAVVGNSSFNGKMLFNNYTISGPSTGLLGGNGDKIVLYEGGPISYPYSIGVDGSTVWNSGPTGAMFKWFSSGTERFRINSDGSAWLQGALTQNSDKRIKSNITIVNDPLEKVRAINGYTYSRIDSGTETRYMGLIAQEVQDVAPEVVVSQDNGLLSVDYAGLSGLYIECIKALVQENTEIKRRLNDLELKVSALVC